MYSHDFLFAHVEKCVQKCVEKDNLCDFTFSALFYEPRKWTAANPRGPVVHSNKTVPYPTGLTF